MSKYSNLTVEEKEKLQQYVASLKEIKKEIFELVKKSKGKSLDNLSESRKEIKKTK